MDSNSPCGSSFLQMNDFVGSPDPAHTGHRHTGLRTRNTGGNGDTENDKQPVTYAQRPKCAACDSDTGIHSNHACLHTTHDVTYISDSTPLKRRPSPCKLTAFSLSRATVALSYSQVRQTHVGWCLHDRPARAGRIVVAKTPVHARVGRQCILAPRCHFCGPHMRPKLHLNC